MFSGRVARNRRVLSLADQALMSVVNMATTVIIGRTCAKTQLGLYASGLSLVLLITAVQSSLISVPYTMSSPRLSGEAHRTYKGSTFFQQAGLSVVAFLILLSFGIMIHARPESRELGQIILTLAACSWLICFRDFARRVSYAELSFSSAILLDGIVALLQMGGIAALAWTGNLTAVRALAVVGAANGLAGAMWLTNSWQTLHFSATHIRSDLRQNWHFGRWVFGSSVLWSSSIDQYPWLLTAMRGASETALWACCYGVMSFLNPFVLALSNDAAPRVANDFAAGGLSGLRKSVLRSSGIACLISLPVVVVLLLFGSRLVRLMYGAKYTNVGTIVALLTIGFWIYATGIVFGYGMLTLKRPALDFTVNMAGFVLFITVGLWLVRSHGAFGAACSFVAVQIVVLICRILGFNLALRQARAAESIS